MHTLVAGCLFPGDYESECSCDDGQEWIDVPRYLGTVGSGHVTADGPVAPSSPKYIPSFLASVDGYLWLSQ